jgi:hypothetical protein
MKKIIILSLIVLALTLTACAGSNVNLDEPDSKIQLTTPGPNPEEDTPAANGNVAGLGTGIWHGLIALVTLVMSFFNPEVHMYEVHNSGALYNLGFFLGFVILFAVLGLSSRR